MRQLTAFGTLLLGCMLLLCGSALAQPTGTRAKQTKASGPDSNVLVRFKLLQMSDTQAKKVVNKRTVKKPPSGKLLHSSELLTLTSKSSLLHLGEKWPIVYYDSRSQFFQMQYVDIGMKLDLILKPAASGNMELEVRPETSNIKDVKSFGSLQTYPKTTVFITESIYPELKHGETLILGRISGPAAKKILTAEGLDTTSDHLVYTLSWERP